MLLYDNTGNIYNKNTFLWKELSKIIQSDNLSFLVYFAMCSNRESKCLFLAGVCINAVL